MNVHLLRRAATLLRNPYLCNWDHAVAHALADWLADTADLQNIADLNRDEVHGLDHAVAVTRALLRSFGHSCGDRPDEPCSSCRHRVPTPADLEGDPR